MGNHHDLHWLGGDPVNERDVYRHWCLRMVPKKYDWRRNEIPRCWDWFQAIFLWFTSDKRGQM